MSDHFDVAVIGAGAAGMMCASVAGQRGKRVVLIDHAEKLAEKIRISGGGRCNFTHIDTSPQNFLSQNPHFCKIALSRYTPLDNCFAIVRRKILLRCLKRNVMLAMCSGACRFQLKG